MNSRLHNSILVAVLGLSVCGVTTGYVNAFAVGIGLRDLLKKDAYYLRTYKLQSDETLRKIYPFPTFARDVATDLEKLRYNVFAERRINDRELPNIAGHFLGAVTMYTA